MSAPIPFQGTPEEARANYDTHRWMNYDGEVECDFNGWPKVWNRP